MRIYYYIGVCTKIEDGIDLERFFSCLPLASPLMLVERMLMVDLVLLFRENGFIEIFFLFFFSFIFFAFFT